MVSSPLSVSGMRAIVPEIVPESSGYENRPYYPGKAVLISVSTGSWEAIIGRPVFLVHEKVGLGEILLIGSFQRAMGHNVV